ncbi:MAG: ribonuclease III [Clostridia bacterium]|nr:ribonuclease III [Clostridia bacterium]
MNNLHELEKKLGYTFKNAAFLRDALTHRSFLNECSSEARVCNERLEFLGDAVLEIAVSEYIYKNYPDLGEGKMSQIRSVVVCESGLYAFAKEMNIGKFIYMAHGEDSSGGRDKPSILSDAIEAIIAAVYLDSDFNTAKDFVIKHFEKYIVSAINNKKSDDDYKSRLQEYALSKAHKIDYILIKESGPDHEKVFTVKVLYNDEISSTGTGTSKKKAQQQAAKAMLEILKS